jgi:hypothetical protein
MGVVISRRATQGSYVLQLPGIVAALEKHTGNSALKPVKQLLLTMQS